MAEYTDFLGLLKKDPVKDAADTFNIQTMLNENWDKIDEFCPGTAKIATGSYEGTGTYGSANPNTITITPNTQMIFICSSVTTRISFFIRGCPGINLVNTFVHGVTCDWSENSVSWYCSGNAAVQPQMNESDITYHYIAFSKEG